MPFILDEVQQLWATDGCPNPLHIVNRSTHYMSISITDLDNLFTIATSTTIHQMVTIALNMLKPSESDNSLNRSELHSSSIHESEDPNDHYRIYCDTTVTVNRHLIRTVNYTIILRPLLQVLLNVWCSQNSGMISPSIVNSLDIIMCEIPISHANAIIVMLDDLRIYISTLERNQA